MKKNQLTAEKMLENFDISNLDLFEQLQYSHLINQSSKVEVLQILINNVEGDYSQLSNKLADIAELQEYEKLELITF